MIKRIFEAIKDALLGVWEHEVFGPIIRVILWAFALIGLFTLVLISIMGWIYIIFVAIR